MGQAPNHNQGPQIVSCVTYTGELEGDGGLVILRGCELTPSEIRTDGKECISRGLNNFLYPIVGNVRVLEKCYCSGNGCNGQGNSARKQVVGFLTWISGFIMYFYF